MYTTISTDPLYSAVWFTLAPRDTHTLVPLANLLNSIYDSIEQADHLIAHESGVVLLDKVATADSCDGTYGFAFVRDATETFVVATPSGVGISHGQNLGCLHCTLVRLLGKSFPVMTYDCEVRASAQVALEFWCICVG